MFADSAAGWRGAFLTLAAGYLIVGMLLLLRIRHIHSPTAAPGQRIALLASLKSVMGTPWARVILLAVFAEGVFLLGPMSYLPAYLHQRHGFSLSGASALLALYAVGGLVYAVAARHLVRRLGERRMALWGGILMGGGFLAWWALPVGWPAGPVALAVGFGTYLYHNTLQTHATQMTPAVRGTSVAMFAFCFFAGQAFGVTLAGLAFDHLGATVLLLGPAVALPLAGWLFAGALRRRALAA